MKNKKIKKEITFFYTDHIEKNTWLNLKKKFNAKGYKTSYSRNLKKKVEIGFYNHDQNIKNNARFSVVTLHGMDQGRASWPNAWKKTRWDFYDIGLLPGKAWVKLWKTSSHKFEANPKKGVFEVGWPKSDNIYSVSFKKKVKEIKKKLNLKKKTILYAPSFETDNKQLDILNLAKKLNLNLVVKHWASKEDRSYSDIYKNITKMNMISKKEYKDVFVFSPKSNIFLYLALADILITDESSVMYEGMLFGVPTIIPNEWVMRTNNTNKPRPIKPSKHAYLNCTIENLPKKVSWILKNKIKVKNKINKQKFLHFSNIRYSSNIIVYLIHKVINNVDLVSNIKKRKAKNENFLIKIKNYFKNYYV